MTSNNGLIVKFLTPTCHIHNIAHRWKWLGLLSQNPWQWWWQPDSILEKNYSIRHYPWCVSGVVYCKISNIDSIMEEISSTFKRIWLPGFL
jgi:hypothetical protein